MWVKNSGYLGLCPFFQLVSSTPMNGLEMMNAPSMAW